MKPLDGILVVSMDQAAAAPFCASRLADAGARVIKVERKGGDFARGYDSVVAGQSTYFVWLNRGKESIEIDIKDPEDAALLHRMIDRADVFLQNLAPGAAARAGFGADDLRARNPRLITCEISGYGDTGPFADMKAYDLLVQAETGLASVTGTPESPARVGVPICDITAGMYALTAILQALIQRDRTGEGTAIQVSLFDGLADWMTVPLWTQEFTGEGLKRYGLNHPAIAPYGVFETADGQVMIAVQNEREWVNLCRDVLRTPDLATDPRFGAPDTRMSNRDALTESMEAVLRTLPREEVVARLRAAKIAFSSVNTAADLSRHPQLRRTQGDTPNGPVDFVASPMRFDGASHTFGPIPALDEHGDAIRAEFAAAAQAAE